MDGAETIPGLDGARRQQVGAGLWAAWRNEHRGAAVLTGFSGLGKSDRVVRPLLVRAGEEGIPTVHIDIPLHPTNLDQELLADVVESLVSAGDDSLADITRKEASFSAALPHLLRRGALIVIDEFQRVLDPSTGRPQEPLGGKLLKLAQRRPDSGCLWLVSNRLVDPAWTEPFHTAELRAPDEMEDVQRIILEALGSADAEERFPAGRQTEVAGRLGRNPRLLRLLGTLLRYYSVDELLGPPSDIPETPPDLRLTEGIERMLLSKAKESLSPAADGLLRDLSILRDPAPWELVQAIGRSLGDLTRLTRELRDRYLLENRSNRYQVHPVIREVDGLHLREDSAAWRAAHLRAGEWYVKPLLAVGSGAYGGDVTLALGLSGARYHLMEAQAEDVLREAVRAVGGYIAQKYHWSTPRPLSDTERDGRIALLDLFLENAGPAGTEFHLAKLLKERAGPGDLEKALPHAERATNGQDQSDPWVLWVQLVREVQGLEAGVVAARKATAHVSPTKNLYTVYQLLGAFLDHLGRTEVAIAELLRGAERTVEREFRLVEEALFFAAADASRDLLRQVRHWAVERERFDPNIALCDVLLLEHQGRWREGALAARLARDEYPRHLHLALHEAFCWIGVGDPEAAQLVLDSFPGGLEYDARESVTWLAALVSLHTGKFERASRLLAVYLDSVVPVGADDLRARLLREWDHRVATIGEPNPALNFPVLPPTVTGLERNTIRPQYGPPVLPQHRSESPPPPVESDGRLRVLAVATEWHSGHGGLSTLNRRLCCALADAGADVICLVLKAGGQDTDGEVRPGVRLVEATPTPGVSEESALSRKPRLPDGFVPDIIIGHGRVTGPAARILAEDHFPGAKRLHFVHMAPDEIEWFKLDRSDDAGERAETRTQIELYLGRTAERVVAVGPRLYQRYLNELSAFAGPLPIRLDPGFDADDRQPRRPPPGEPWKVLMLGRMEDGPLKGLDLAARAVGLAASRRSAAAAPLELVVRGAQPDTSMKLRDELRGSAGFPALGVVVRPYTTDAERLEADLRRASLLVMPSRSEGFGLVGLEAIVAGTPVLVSGESGLGALLHEVLGEELASRLVVPMSGDDKEDADRWARAVEAVLRDRGAAFRQAGEVRDRLAREKTWAAAVAGLLAELEVAPGRNV